MFYRTLCQINHYLGFNEKEVIETTLPANGALTSCDGRALFTTSNQYYTNRQKKTHQFSNSFQYSYKRETEFEK